MRRLIRFIREAWRLVRKREAMTVGEYEEAKAELVERYTREE